MPGTLPLRGLLRIFWVDMKFFYSEPIPSESTPPAPTVF